MSGSQLVPEEARSQPPCLYIARVVSEPSIVRWQFAAIVLAFRYVVRPEGRRNRETKHSHHASLCNLPSSFVVRNRAMATNLLDFCDLETSLVMQRLRELMMRSLVLKTRSDRVERCMNLVGSVLAVRSTSSRRTERS